jgi:ribosomal protein L29
MTRLEDSPTSLADIYPQLSAEELNEAEDNMRRYLMVVRKVFEHIQAENPKMLTDLRRRARLRKEKAHK